MSIKEGDGEKVEEMRGREKLVRTPQQVFVFLLYLSSHVFVFVSGWCICICIILVYLYLYQVGEFVFVLGWCICIITKIIITAIVFSGEQQGSRMLRRSCIFSRLDMGRFQNETFGNSMHPNQCI